MTIAYILGFAVTILFFAQLEARMPEIGGYPISTYLLISAVWPVFWAHYIVSIIRELRG